MSHGPSHGQEKADPNLIPLLDLVLQLIMFFMMTVNFVNTNQINQAINLPEAQSGVPLDKKIQNILFLNMDQDGRLVIPDARTETDTEIETYLLNEKKNRKVKFKEDSLLVVLRADTRASSDSVFRVLRLCIEAQIVHYQTRAMEKNP